MTTRQLGDRGEAMAAAYLEQKGYIVLERQYRFERAELDLICFHPSADGQGGEVVFVEVKTRRGMRFGRPEEAISEAKKTNMIRVAEAYLHETRLEGALCRFDVVAIILNQNPEPQIQHFENAFWIFG